MLSIDTGLWDPADRVERWREEFGRNVIRAEVTAAGSQAQEFGVRMAMLGGESLGSLHMRLRAVRKVRDRAWFGDGADDLTFMLCMAGAVRFDTNGVRHVLRRGEAVLFSHVVPVELGWDDARIATLQLPRASLADLPDPERLAGRVLARTNRARAMLDVYLAELWRQRGPFSVRAERHLVELVVESLTGAVASAGRASGRSGPRLAALRALIRARATEALGIEQVGRALGVSMRTVERDLAAAGTSFADELAATRLDLALQRLRSGDERIADIAFAVGFNDLSNFNRRFKARFGHAPSEERGRG